MSPLYSLDVPTKIAFCSSALCKISSFFSSDFLLGCDTCDSKKTTSLLECARYTYARGKRSIRCSLFSCFAPLSSSLRFCADNKLQSDYFDKYDYQIGCKHKIRCQFFAIFSLFGAISPHIHIGAHDGGVHHFPFSFTAKANLKYKIQVTLEPSSIIFTPTQLFAQCQILLEQPLVFTRSEFLAHFFISLFPISV